MLAAFGAGLGLLVAERGIVALQRIAATALPAGTAFALEPRVVLFAMAAASAAFVSSLVPALGATRAVGTRAAPRRGPGVAFAREPPAATRPRCRAACGIGCAPRRRRAVSPDVSSAVGAGSRIRHRTGGDLPPAVHPAASTGNRKSSGRHSTSNCARFRACVCRRREYPDERPEHRHRARDRRPLRRDGAPAGRALHAGIGRLLRGARHSDRARPRVQRRRSGGRPAVAVVSADLATTTLARRRSHRRTGQGRPAKPWFTIVGIAGDVRMGGADAPRPSIYTSQRQDHWPGGGAVVMRGGEANSCPLARRFVRRSRTRGSRRSRSSASEHSKNSAATRPLIAERRLQMQLMLLFAIVALVVSAIGVYGVSAYATEARRREFGIRMALGASQRGVLWLALRDAPRSPCSARSPAFPSRSLLASRLRDMLFAVTPFDPDGRRRARNLDRGRLRRVARAGPTRHADRSGEDDENGLGELGPDSCRPSARTALQRFRTGHSRIEKRHQRLNLHVAKTQIRHLPIWRLESLLS